ncbi:MAG: hypothetical protein K0R75_3580, partial [Paenibacillaceae bacterium]|nr:hypothetical protein [Paenibacillaceae bacterium]
MNLDIHERVGELERKVKDLEEQIAELQGRGRVREQGRLENMAGERAGFAPQKEFVHQSPVEQPVRPVDVSIGPDAVPITEPPIDWEYLLAKVWLPRIFIVVLLVGVLWGFTAAVNAGIITEPVRCLLGVIAAGILYWQGERQLRHARPALGQVLLGGSVAVLMLALFAAHMLYGLIPAWLAFILYVLSIAAGVYIAVQHRSQTLMVIAMVAGYLVPFLVESANPNMWVFASYEAIFSVAMILLSVRYEYRAAFYVAFGLLHLPLIIGNMMGNGEEGRIPFLAAVILQHAVLYGLSVVKPNRGQLDTSIVLLTGFSLMAAWMRGLFEDDQVVYQSLMAAWSVIYSVTAYLNWKRRESEVNVHLGVATFGWFLWLIFVLKAVDLSAAILAEGAIAIYLGLRLNSKLQQATGIIAYLFGVVGLVAYPIRHIVSMETLGWLIMVGTIGWLYEVVRKMPSEAWYKPYQSSLVWADALLILIFISEITRVLTKPLTTDMQHLVLSIVWVAYAVLVIVIGVVANKRKAR